MSPIEQALSHTTPVYHGPWNGLAHTWLAAQWQHKETTMMELPVLQKPAYGQPCTGCGQCCQEDICRIGQQMYPDAQAPCPALRWHDERYWCGLVEMVKDSRVDTAALTMMLGIGMGCDATIDGR